MERSGLKIFGLIFGLVIIVSVAMMLSEAYKNKPAQPPPGPVTPPGHGQQRLPGQPQGNRVNTPGRPGQDASRKTNSQTSQQNIQIRPRTTATKPAQPDVRDQRREIAFDRGYVKWTKKLTPNPLLNRELAPLVLPSIADRPIRLALIGNADTRDLLLILQAQLSGRQRLEFVDRADLEKVLDEQALVALLGDESVTQKTRIGRLLKADLILTVASDLALPGQSRVGISETHLGLTLARLTFDDKNAPDETASRLAILVDRALGQLGQPIDQLVAVPQTTATNLELENRDLVYAVGRLIESKLTSNAGVLAIELKDAGVIGTEAWLPNAQVAQPLVRPIPIYFTSSLEQLPDKGQFIVGLTAQQADKVLGQWKSDPVDRQAVAQAVGSLVAKAFEAKKLKLLAGDSAYEEMQLLNKIRDYYLLGEYESALETVNALLIVAPEDAYRVLALDLVRKVIHARYRPGESSEKFQRVTRQSIDLWRQSRRYLDQLTPRYSIYEFSSTGPQPAFIYRSYAVRDWHSTFDLLKIDPRIQGNTSVVAQWIQNEVDPAYRQIADQLGIYLPSMWNLQGSTDYRFGLDTIYDSLPQTALWSQPPPRLQSLDLNWHDSAGRPYPIQPTGWIQAGEKTDFLWERHGRHACYLVKNGVVSSPIPIHTSPVRLDGSQTSEGIYWASFDGASIWVPVVSSTPQVHVLDLATGRTTTFTQADGIPPMDRQGSACGISPGKAVVVGSYSVDGKTPQSWAALCSLDEKGNKQVKLITRIAGVENLFNRRNPDSAFAFDPGWSLRSVIPATPDKPARIKASFATGTGRLFSVFADDLSTQITAGIDSSAPGFPPCVTQDGRIIRGAVRDGRYPCVTIQNPITNSNQTFRTVPQYHSFVEYNGVIVGANRRGFLGALTTDSQAMAPLLGDVFETPETVLLMSSNFGPIMLAPERPGSVYTPFKLKLQDLAPQPAPQGADPAKDITLDVRISQSSVITLSPSGLRVGAVLDLNKANFVKAFLQDRYYYFQFRIDGTTVTFPGKSIADRQGHMDMGVQYDYPFPDIANRRIQITSVASDPADLDKPGLHVNDYYKPAHEKLPVHFIRGDLPSLTTLQIQGGADGDWVRLKIHAATPPAASAPPATQPAPWDNIPLTKNGNYFWSFQTPAPADKDMWISIQQVPYNFRSSGLYIVNPDGRMWLMPDFPGIHPIERFNLRVPRYALQIPGTYSFVQYDPREGLSLAPNPPEIKIIALLREPSRRNMDQPPTILMPYTAPDGTSRPLKMSATASRLHSAAQRDNLPSLKNVLDEDEHLGGIDADGATALGKAASPQIADALIKAGLPIDFPSPTTGATAPLFLASFGQTQTLKHFFTKYGVKPDIVDNNGNGLFHYAATLKGSPEAMQEMLKFLHDQKVDINIKNKDGRTPLMTLGASPPAIKFKDIPKVFMDLGADKNLTDNQGKTASQITTSRFIREVIETGQTPDLAKFRRPPNSQTQPAASQPSTPTPQ